VLLQGLDTADVGEAVERESDVTPTCLGLPAGEPGHEEGVGAVVAPSVTTAKRRCGTALEPAGGLGDEHR